MNGHSPGTDPGEAHCAQKIASTSFSFEYSGGANKIRAPAKMLGKLGSKYLLNFYRHQFH